MPNEPTLPQSPALPCTMVLDHLGVIEVSGQDAAAFLHSQFTNDVQHLKADGVILGGYCQAKGRMLASFWLWQQVGADGPIYRLALSADIVAGILKRLSMFVLRAKVKLADVSAQVPVYGWIGTSAQTLSLPDGVSVSPQTALTCLHTDAATLVWIPAPLGLQRALIVPAARADSDGVARLAAAIQGNEVPVSAALWRWLDIHAAIARIEAKTQEAFVPQMINFELVNGVSFKKGCYPGQEIVARSQYLGKLKRRSFLARTAAGGILAGADVNAPGGSEPVGRVVNAEPNAVGGTDMLIETTLSAAEGPLEVSGASLTLLPMPYPFPAEAA